MNRKSVSDVPQKYTPIGATKKTYTILDVHGTSKISLNQPKLQKAQGKLNATPGKEMNQLTPQKRMET